MAPLWTLDAWAEARRPAAPTQGMACRMTQQAGRRRRLANNAQEGAQRFHTVELLQAPAAAGPGVPAACCMQRVQGG